MRQKRLIALLFLLVGALGASLGISKPEALDDIRNFVFDRFQRVSPPAYDPSAPVRILAIDDASLVALGQWPWPRTRLAEIVNALGQAGAAAIVFDIIFAEPDRTSLENVVAALAEGPLKADLATRIGADASNDALFARAVGSGPVALGATLQTQGEKRTWPAKAGFVVAGDDAEADITPFASAALPIPVLLDATTGLGATNWLADHDQIVRRAPLLVRTGDAIMPSLALEAFRLALGGTGYVLRAANASGTTSFGAQTGLNSIVVTGPDGGLADIATDGNGFVRPRFTRSAPERFLSAASLLAGRVAPDEVRGRVVFVGATAIGLGDVRATPLDPTVPGVEVHAQLLEQLRTGRLLSRPAWALGAELATTLLCLLVVALLLPRAPPLVAALATALALALLFAGSWLAFDRASVLVDATFPALTIAFAYLSGASLLWQTEQRAKRQVRHAFGKFVSPAVVARIAENPKLLVLSGETRDLTILFSDLRSFSTISEGLDAHAVARFLNEYLTPMTDVILAHDGTVDKYIGDAIVAFWNAPLDVPDHTRRAVDASLAMREALARFNARPEGGAEPSAVRDVRMGVGLNFGACSVGNMGSAQRFDYSALGDPVNVAARLESLTKSYAVDVLASLGVRDRTPDYAWLEVDEVRVKGRSAVTRLFALAGSEAMARSPAFESWAGRHGAMLRSAGGGRFAEAETAALALAGEVAPHWRPLYEALAGRYRVQGDSSRDDGEAVTLAPMRTAG